MPMRIHNIILYIVYPHGHYCLLEFSNKPSVLFLARQASRHLVFEILAHLPYPTYLNFPVCSLDCFEKEYRSSVRIFPYFHFCHGEDGSHLFQLHNSSVELEHIVKPVLSDHSKRRPKIGFQDYRLMQVKSFAERGAFSNTFDLH